MKIDFDVDIDMPDRDKFLELVEHIPASIKRGEIYEKHKTGVYFQPIPVFPLEGYSTIDHKDAEQKGFFKVDFLNNTIYQSVTSEAHLDRLLHTEPLWELFGHEEVVSQLYHINNYASILKEYTPSSIEELAMILAIIRPAKKHLMGKSFEEISQTVWKKPDSDQYYFKKAHAIAFATAIIVQLNLICEGVSTQS